MLEIKTYKRQNPENKLEINLQQNIMIMKKIVVGYMAKYTQWNTKKKIQLLEILAIWEVNSRISITKRTQKHGSFVLLVFHFFWIWLSSKLEKSIETPSENLSKKREDFMAKS